MADFLSSLEILKLVVDKPRAKENYSMYIIYFENYFERKIQTAENFLDFVSTLQSFL